jgi:Protein phosphatase 2C
MTRTGDGGLLCQQLRMPRHGHSVEECQDASAANADRGRFAVADGASESPHAALWASLLVDAFVRSPDTGLGCENWLPAVQQHWAASVTPGPEQQPLPWYLEAGVKQGAFATFLGLVVTPDPNASGNLWLWEALAVGDSCVFQTRGDILLQAFPVARSVDFDNTPWLVCSRGSPRQWGDVRQGVGRPNDRLWLMTDALAQWFLAQAERGGQPWRPIDELFHQPDAETVFSDWIGDLRRSRQLRNDDVTLLRVVISH